MQDIQVTDRRRLRGAWGAWLGEYEWSHIVHLTTATPFSEARLVKAFRDEFVRYAEKVAQNPVPYWFAVEGGALGDRPHIHALLAGAERLTTAQLVGAWRHARPERLRVSEYDAALGASYYITKEIGGRALDYGASKRFPRRLYRAA